VYVYDYVNVKRNAHTKLSCVCECVLFIGGEAAFIQSLTSTSSKITTKEI